MGTLTNNIRGTPMTMAPTTPSQGTFTRLASRAVNLNVWMLLLRCIAFGNFGFLFTLLWAIFHPEAPIGLLEFVVRDIGQPRGMVIAFYAAWFVADIVHWARGVKPGYQGLYSVSGMAWLAGTALVYTLTGEAGFIRFAGFFGAFALSVLGIVAAAQDVFPRNSHPQAKRYIIPTISAILLFYFLGLLTRPDGAIAQFIRNEFNFFLYVAILFLLIGGHGYLRRNHVAPGAMIVAVSGQIFLSLMLIGLFLSGQDVSAISLFVHIFVSALLVCFVYMQTEPDMGRA